jgi:nucleoside-triphosphatase THEP1
MNPKSINILTGQKHSGKTTAIQQWIAGKDSVAGILSPIIANQRQFQLIPSGEVFLMESADEQEPAFYIGRYRFSIAAFEKAIRHVLTINKESITYLVLDEIGPLEMKGEGFHNLLKQLIHNRHLAAYKLLLVIREGMVDEFMNQYGLVKEDCIILQKEALQLLS